MFTNTPSQHHPVYCLKFTDAGSEVLSLSTQLLSQGGSSEDLCHANPLSNLIPFFSSRLHSILSCYCLISFSHFITLCFFLTAGTILTSPGEPSFLLIFKRIAFSEHSLSLFASLRQRKCLLPNFVPMVAGLLNTLGSFFSPHICWSHSWFTF